jgi:hypothetical protein
MPLKAEYFSVKTSGHVSLEINKMRALRRFRTSQEDPTSPKKVPRGEASVDIILEGWAKDNAWALDQKPRSRALYHRQRTMERLATFVGHRDAARIT